MILATALVVLFAGAPSPEPPVCPGGSELVTTEVGTGKTMECKRRDGRLQGPFLKVYTPTGTVTEKGAYQDNELHGLWSMWDTKGVLREQGEYRAGIRTGWWATFHENGKKESAGEMSAGEPRGLWTWWDENGKVAEEGEYRAGQKHGLWTTYDTKTGRVKSQVEYANGQPR